MSDEHPFDVDAVTRAILAHKPAGSVTEIAEIAVAALSDRLTACNRYREALESIAQWEFSVGGRVAREALDASRHAGADGMKTSGDRTVLLRWSVEVNRDDLERNDIIKPPEEWEPNDLAHADSLGLIYAWEIEVHAERPA